VALQAPRHLVLLFPQLVVAQPQQPMALLVVVEHRLLLVAPVVQALVAT
jgi:hypothetical protein